MSMSEGFLLHVLPCLFVLGFVPGCGDGPAAMQVADVPASEVDAPDVPAMDAGNTDAGGVDAPDVSSCPGSEGLRGTPECLACQSERCCIVAANCAADPECVALLACTDSECRGAHQAGIWNWSGLTICHRNNCAAECRAMPARCGSITPHPASCVTCLRDECCAEATACGASAGCLAFIYQCLDQNQCASSACIQECRERYPEGAAVFDPMDACLRTRCRGC